MCTIQANATTWVHAIESGSLDSASSVHQQITHFRFKLRAPKSLHLLESCTNVESGRNGVSFSGFVNLHPNGCFCSEMSHIQGAPIHCADPKAIT